MDFPRNNPPSPYWVPAPTQPTPNQRPNHLSFERDIENLLQGILPEESTLPHQPRPTPSPQQSTPQNVSRPARINPSTHDINTLIVNNDNEFLEHLWTTYIEDALVIRAVKQHNDNNASIQPTVFQCQNPKSIESYDNLRKYTYAKTLKPEQDIVNDIFLNPFTRLTPINHTILGLVDTFKLDQCFISVRAHFIASGSKSFQFESAPLTILLHLILLFKPDRPVLLPLIRKLYNQIQKVYGNNLDCTFIISNHLETHTYHKFNLTSLFMLIGLLPDNLSPLSEAAIAGFFSQKTITFFHKASPIAFNLSKLLSDYYLKKRVIVTSDLNLLMIENLLQEALNLYKTQQSIHKTLVIELMRLYNKFEVVSTFYTDPAIYIDNLKSAHDIINLFVGSQNANPFRKAIDKKVNLVPLKDDPSYLDPDCIPFEESRYDIKTYLPHIHSDTRKAINENLNRMRRGFITFLYLNGDNSDTQTIKSIILDSCLAIRKSVKKLTLNEEDRKVIDTLFQLFDLHFILNSKEMKKYIGCNEKDEITVTSVRTAVNIIFVFLLNNIDNPALCKIFLDEMKRLCGNLSPFLYSPLKFTKNGNEIISSDTRPPHNIRNMLSEKQRLDLYEHFGLSPSNPVTIASLIQPFSTQSGGSIEDVQIFRKSFHPEVLKYIVSNRDHFRIIAQKIVPSIPALPPAAAATPASSASSAAAPATPKPPATPTPAPATPAIKPSATPTPLLVASGSLNDAAPDLYTLGKNKIAFNKYFEQLTPNQKIVFQKYALKFLELIETKWRDNPLFFNSLVESVYKGQCVFPVNIDDFKQKQFFIDSLLEFPIPPEWRKFLNCYLSALKLFISGRNYKAVIDIHVTDSDEKKYRKAIINQIFNLPHRDRPHKLSEQKSLEVCTTLVALKFKELRMLFSNLEFAYCDPSINRDARNLPLLLIDQDGLNVHVDLLSLNLTLNMIHSVIQDPNHFCEKVLKTYLNIDLPQDDNPEREVTLDLKQLQVLKNVLLKNAKNPPFLILQRQKPKFNTAVEELPPTTEEKEPLPPADAVMDAQAEDIQSEESDSPSPEEIEGISQVRKRKKPSETGSSKKKTRHNDPKEAAAHRQFSLTGEYKPASLENQPLNKVPQLPGNKKGVAPSLDIAKIKENEEALEISDMSSFLALNSVNELSVTEKKLVSVHAMSQAILECKPIDHPVLAELEALPPVETLTCFDPTLKDYQIQEVSKIFHFALHNMVCMTSLRMGLGKTNIFCQVIMQRIAHGYKGASVIIEPVNLIDDIYKAMQNVQRDSVATVWKVCFRGRQQLTEDNRKAFVQEMNTLIFNTVRDLKDNPYHLSITLRILAELKAEEVYVLFKNARFERNINSDLMSSVTKQVCEQLDKTISFNHPLPDKIEDIQNKIVKALNVLHENLKKMNHPHADKIKAYKLKIYELKEEEIVRTLREILLLAKEGCRKPSDLEFCCHMIHFASAIFDINPHARYPLFNVLHWDNYKRIRELKYENIARCETGALLGEALSRSENQIIVTSFPAIERSPVKVTSVPLSFVAADEAQRLHTETTNVNGLMTTLVREAREEAAKKGEKAPCFVCSTGTPFENNIAELWNLLRIFYGDKFLPSSNNALSRLLEDTVASLGENDFLNSRKNVIHAFAQFVVFRDLVLKKLITRLNMQSPEIQAQWKGLIPTVTRKSIDATPYISAAAQAAITRTETTFFTTERASKAKKGEKSQEKTLNQMNLLHHIHKIKAVLLLSSLEGKSLDKSKSHTVEGTAKTVSQIVNEIYAQDHAQQKVTLADSTMISALLDTPQIEEAVTNSYHSLVLVDIVLGADLIADAIKKKYPQAECRIYSGELTLEQKSAAVEWYNKREKKPKFFMLMIRAGGVGLNLQVTDKFVFKMVKSWNFAEDEQAEARADRIGTQKDRIFVEFTYPNVFAYKHVTAVTESKRSWENFLFGEDRDLGKQFDDWCELVKMMAYHAALNQYKNLDKSQEALEKLETKVTQIKESLVKDGKNPLEELAAYVAKATPVRVPKVSRVVVEDLPMEDMPDPFAMTL